MEILQMLYWDLTMPMTTWQNRILILEPLLDELEIGKGGKKMREITILNFELKVKMWFQTFFENNFVHFSESPNFTKFLKST